MLNLKIRLLNPTLELPTYQTTDSAGIDLAASLTEAITLQPQARSLIPTGIAIALPSGYLAQVCPRSGLALKHGITVLNAPGIIDADYRGEIGVVLINLGNEDFTITPGMRIAQLIVMGYQQATWQVCDDLEETLRGVKGFGSTGL